jgi:hypothetical protein
VSYRWAIATLGTLLTVAAASVSAAYLAIALFPPFLALAVAVLLFTSTAQRQIRIGAVGSGALAVATAVYAGNHGNWNQPGLFWLFIVAVGGVVLSGANVFAICAHTLISPAVTFLGSTVLLAIAATGYWWLLNADAGRADLFMLRADTLFVGLYSGTALLIFMNRAYFRR